MFLWENASFFQKKNVEFATYCASNATTSGERLALRAGTRPAPTVRTKGMKNI